MFHHVSHVSLSMPNTPMVIRLISAVRFVDLRSEPSPAFYQSDELSKLFVSGQTFLSSSRPKRAPFWSVMLPRDFERHLLSDAPFLKTWSNIGQCTKSNSTPAISPSDLFGLCKNEALLVHLPLKRMAIRVKEAWASGHQSIMRRSCWLLHSHVLSHS